MKEIIECNQLDDEKNSTESLRFDQTLWEARIDSIKLADYLAKIK